MRPALLAAWLCAAPALAARVDLSQQLIEAVDKGNLAAAKELLAKGADPNARDANATVLMKAAIQGRLPLVKALLERGADVNAVAGSSNYTALVWAADNGHAAVVKELLAAGADPNHMAGIPYDKNIFPSGRWSALFGAANKDHALAAEALLDGGADPNIRLDREWAITPLMEAASQGRAATVRALLAGGADPGLVDPKGRTPLELAEHASDRRNGVLVMYTTPDWPGTLRALRDGVPRRERPAAAAPAGGVSQEEMRLMVSQAAQQAAQAAARSQAPAAPAQPGVSKEEMRLMMAEAVKQASQPKAPEPAASSDVDSPAFKLPEKPDHYAVVIGVEKYEDLPEARFAERDAAAVKAHLLAMGYPERNVVLLAGRKASRASMAKNLETWLARNVKEGSTVFVYFSGHGAPDVKSGQAYLLPWDGDPQFLEDTAYPVKRLYAKLNATKASDILVVLDACFSGAGGRSVLAKGARPLVTRVDAGAAAVGRLTVFSASGPDEITGAEEAQGHGLFTYHFLKGLSGSARGGAGRVTVGSLYGYLVPKVQDGARRQNREQTPLLNAPDPGRELLPAP